MKVNVKVLGGNYHTMVSRQPHLVLFWAKSAVEVYPYKFAYNNLRSVHIIPCNDCLISILYFHYNSLLLLL